MVIHPLFTLLKASKEENYLSKGYTVLGKIYMQHCANLCSDAPTPLPTLSDARRGSRLWRGTGEIASYCASSSPQPSSSRSADCRCPLPSTQVLPTAPISNFQPPSLLDTYSSSPSHSLEPPPSLRSASLTRAIPLSASDIRSTNLQAAGLSSTDTPRLCS
jgi:hypothetical protein